MNIKPMLVRLQNAIGRDDLLDKMVLMSPKNPIERADKSPKSITLAVGYNGSPKSHAALDLALLMAHQTRLATSKQVIIQVVYVVDENQNSERQIPLVFSSACRLKPVSTAITQTRSNALAEYSLMTLAEAYPLEATSKNNSFERADRILWQARCLVDEWRDSSIAHLRFGDVATELKEVARSESATILFLGCSSVDRPLIQQLGSDFPCPVLGVPNSSDELCSIEC